VNWEPTISSVAPPQYYEEISACVEEESSESTPSFE